MNVRLIVPRRADGGHRDRLWAYCMAHWEKELPAAEIVEGHHDGGPFNRSAAINRAAEGEWDVAVILDGDTVLDAELVEAAVQCAADTGKLVLPFKIRRLLDRHGTRKILTGYVGAWDQWAKHREGLRHVSSCIVVPRALWDQVGGFDERFEGWGGEDDAFHAACKALAGVERLDGAAWHLWHKISPHRDHRTPTYRQAKALSDRYVAAKHAANMHALLAESRNSDRIVLVALTNGRRDTLARTIASAEENLQGPVDRKLLCVDAPNGANVGSVPGWDVVAMGRSRGYAPAVARALELAIGSGQPWIFWLEDDFTFNGPVHLRGMQALMDQHPHLAQLSLMRQPWFEHEVAAGGVIAANPDAFTQREGYVEHRAYWTMNPMLCRRSLLASHQWPFGTGSERQFGQEVFKDRKAAGGILGTIAGPERVTHIGDERAGRGY